MFKDVDPASGGMQVLIASHGRVADDCEKCGRFARLSLAHWGHMLAPLFVCPTCIAEAIEVYGEWKDG